MNNITIQGRSLPVRVTMGALLRFKHATGKEAQDLGGDMEETLTFMHCCLASACKADGIPFEMDVQEMADQLTPDDVNAFAASLSGGEAKKK